MKKVDITTSNDKASIKYGKHTDSSQLSVYGTFSYMSHIRSTRLHTIGVSQKVFDEIGDSSLIIFNNGKFMTAEPIVADVEEKAIKTTQYIKEYLDISEDSEVTLLINKTFSFNKMFIQKIDNIKEDILVLSKSDYDAIAPILSSYKLIKLKNGYTEQSITIKSSHIIPSETIPCGTILLNRKQRVFLGLETRKYLSPDLWNRITDNLKAKNKEEDLQILEQIYKTQDHILEPDTPYSLKERAKKIINSCLPYKLLLFPVIESYFNIKKRKLQRLSDFYVGKSTLNLICRRPYSSDEGTDIVRLTKSNMQILGIDTMDKVILQYDNNQVSCQVLELDEEELFFEENLPIEINYAIGIPVHIRKKLKISGLNCAVKVDRDTGFIFKKSMNEQIVPVLLTFFSVNSFHNINFLLSTIVSLISIPFVVFFNLSSKRLRRGKK